MSTNKECAKKIRTKMQEADPDVELDYHDIFVSGRSKEE
jgi:hypothetical protein